MECWVQFHGVRALFVPVYGSQLGSESLSHDENSSYLLAWSLVIFENIFIHQMLIECLLCARNSAGH